MCSIWLSSLRPIDSMGRHNKYTNNTNSTNKSFQDASGSIQQKRSPASTDVKEKTTTYELQTYFIVKKTSLLSSLTHVSNINNHCGFHFQRHLLCTQHNDVILFCVHMGACNKYFVKQPCFGTGCPGYF
jgi:hypothetical protein